MLFEMGNENIDNSSADHSYFYVSYSFVYLLYCTVCILQDCIKNV